VDDPRIAVVGSGPSGLYTVAALLASGQPLHIDVIDRMPTPYGLVRYGVAPDHAKMKAVTRVLAKPFTNDNVRFVGNIEVGRDLTHDDLAACYDAIVFASGTERDRCLHIPGEDLPGVMGSGEFVRWYNGHPDAAPTDFSLDAEQVAVVGAGNVAVDVARVLGRTAGELRDTDMPARVLAALARSAVRDVHILIRRGPADVKFTPAELFQLSELADTDVVVDNGGDVIDDPALAEDKRVRLNLKTLRTFAETPARGCRRRIHLRFFSAPEEILGAGRVTGIVVERTRRQVQDRVAGSSERFFLPVGMVVTAVGFRGAPLDGLPFSAATGTVPNEAGRVVAGEDVVPGVYVAGWLKRGASGIIGTNRPDGAETAAAVLADLAGRVVPARPDITDLLAARNRVSSDWAGWLRLEEYEGALGEADGRGRVKVHDLESMLRCCATSMRQ
jgi:ferredoxin/flavodoxin---NADP+ reductase